MCEPVRCQLEERVLMRWEKAMAEVSVELPPRVDWVWSKSWPYLLGGLGLTIWSWLWKISFEPIVSDNRVIVLAAGLFFTAIGIWIRWNSAASEFGPRLAVPLRLMLGVVFAGLLVGFGVLFGYTLSSDNQTGWRPGATFLAGLTAMPLAFFAAVRCFRDAEDAERARDVEKSAVFLMGAVVCLIGLSVLFVSRYPKEWDTIRLFLRVLAIACAYGGGLALVSTRVCRSILSTLFALHFIAILTACFGTAPAPWVVQQAWTRLFRPYLDFVYLNNAYHFFAPDPSTSSYVWFRVIFVTPEGKEYGIWHKLPEVDEQGRSQHLVSLEYQRFLSLTEATSYPEAPPALVVVNKDLEPQTNPYYFDRLMLRPGVPDVVGKSPTKHLRIPTHPDLPQEVLQVKVPTDTAHRLLHSFARTIASMYPTHPDQPDWKFKSVKIYRVTHLIAQLNWLQMRIPPNDPCTYHPFYMGTFDQNGNRVGTFDKNGQRMLVDDPYLFWLIPILRLNRDQLDAPIADFCRLHAGDPDWYRPQGEKRWRAPTTDEQKKLWEAMTPKQK